MVSVGIAWLGCSQEDVAGAAVDCRRRHRPEAEPAAVSEQRTRDGFERGAAGEGPEEFA
jgi:hypothetical protein